MTTRQVEIGEIAKVGKFLVLDGEPCKVVDVARSKTGKHGHTKYRIAAVSVFSGKKKVIVTSSHTKVDVPHIDKRTAQILSISGNTVSVMDTESYETFEMEIPEEFQGNLAEGDNVIYWNVLGKNIIQQKK